MKKLVLLLVGLTILSSAALADIFPERRGNVDVIFTDNAYADLAAKIWMIDHAQKSVHISAFVFSQDQVGLTVAEALRRALNRGVSIRVMYEGTIARTLGKDYRLRIPDLLSDPSLTKQAEIINIDILEKRATNLAINDYLHEKLIMVDLATENEMIYLGGRDIADFARTTIDSGYILRPVDRRFSYVGDDLHAYYDKLWTTLSKYFKPYKTTPADVKVALELLSQNIPMDKYYSEEDKKEIYKVIALLQDKPTEGKDLAPNQFRPAFAQIVTNGVLKNLLEGKYKKTSSVRPELYDKDDIANTLIKYVKNSRNVEISAYSSFFAPPLQKALEEFVTRGSLNVYTNGEEVMSSQDALGVAALSYTYSTQGMRELKKETSQTADKENKFSAMGLDRSTIMKKTYGKKNYLHRKLMLFDGAYVATGSYNFTESSSTKNDEFMVIFMDPRMNTHHRAINRAEKDAVFTKMNLSDPQYFQRAKEAVKDLLMGNFVKSQF